MFNTLTSKQLGYISYRIKALRSYDQKVKDLFPDVLENGANIYSQILENSIKDISVADASLVIQHLSDDDTYMLGVNKLLSLM